MKETELIKRIGALVHANRQKEERIHALEKMLKLKNKGLIELRRESLGRQAQIDQVEADIIKASAHYNDWYSRIEKENKELIETIKILKGRKQVLNVK